tara:strand:+ start:246 stop:383 length:138 start_codon:yes stop_codon:yes gene_type:complete
MPYAYTLYSVRDPGAAAGRVDTSKAASLVSTGDILILVDRHTWVE